jgi:uncharacterized membrane protein
MAVAGYDSTAAAVRDFDAVRSLEGRSGAGAVAAAIVDKGAVGEVRIKRHHSGASTLASGRALLGGALIVVAAPTGILYLTPALRQPAEWAGVGAIVSHFWHHCPKDDLRTMSDLLEVGQAAVVVVAIDASEADVAARLANATSMIVTDCTPADFDEEFSNAVDEANTVA